MIGKTILHYTILEKLGEGGMGVVYKARDTKLDRDVALKFLPERIAASADDRARFIREAKLAAGLDHPNICTIFAIDEHDGEVFIAMELIDGVTLREKLPTVNLPKAVEIGIQIAEGLAAAHEKGVVHRDIKPDNVMVRKDGIVQVMDFGLAKLRASAQSRLTKQGSTIGTAGYMSPEQVQGQETDHRSDIFSLGVVLYELFTGEMPFKGVHETALMYEIVNVDAAPMTAVKPELDAELDRIVLECLQKEPDERYNSVKDVAKDLRRFKRESSRSRMSRISAATPISRRTTASTGATGSPGGTDSAGATGSAESIGAVARPSRLPLLSGYILAAVLAAILIVLFLRGGDGPGERPAPPVVRFPIELPQNAPLAGVWDGMSISRDGRQIVYRARIANANQLYLLATDGSESRPVPGTENVRDASFSPDGRWVAFTSVRGEISKVSLSGGSPEKVCPIPDDTRGISWALDSTIYFGMVSDGIYSVSAAGGERSRVIALDTAAGEISHRYPTLLPDGKTLVFVVKLGDISTFNDALIVAQSVDGGPKKVLVRGGTYPLYLPTGHLLYVRGSAILAVPFDPERLEITGAPVQVEEGGWLNDGMGAANIDVSENGLLVYAPLGPLEGDIAGLCWMDRKGILTPIFGIHKTYQDAVLSPDKNRIAVSINAANNDIWVYNIPRDVLTRLTFGGGNSGQPVWSHDGTSVIYRSEKGGTPNLYRRRWDGSGPEVRLTSSEYSQSPASVSPDGKFLLYEERGDLWLLPLGGDEPAAPKPFLQTRALELQAMISPDGRWVAYTSDETGKPEIYATSFPSGEGKWQISNGGGVGPDWSDGGSELFYINGPAMMAVEVTRSAVFDFSQPKKVCDLPDRAVLGTGSIAGKKFLALDSKQQVLTLNRLTGVTEWFEEVRSKFTAPRR